MFGFRSGNPKRKVHTSGGSPKSNAASNRAKGGDGDGGIGLGLMFGQRTPPAHGHTTEDRSFDDNSSLDMSLYTTQSRATVRYPPPLLNYSHGSENDDYDTLSHAPSEFTTEVALNRYSTLGGALGGRTWTPPTPLYHTPASKGASPPFLTPATDPLSNNPSSSEDFDDDSVGASSSDCTGEEETTYSMLPATAKMARFIFRDTPSSPQAQETFTSRMSNGPNADSNTASLETYCKTSKAVASLSTHDKYKYTGPVDLDESIADSASIASSSNSWVAGSSGLASASVYQNAITSAASKSRLGHDGSCSSPEDDDTYGSSTASSSLTGKSRKIATNHSTPERLVPTEPSGQKDDDSFGYSTASSLTSPRPQNHEPTHMDLIKDDDTYGFSITSVSLSGAQSQASGNQRRSRPQQQPPQQLLQQWDEDTYAYSVASSILPKGRGKSGAQVLDDDDSLNLSIASCLSKSRVSRQTKQGRQTVQGTAKDDNSLNQSVAASLSKSRACRQEMMSKSSKKDNGSSSVNRSVVSPSSKSRLNRQVPPTCVNKNSDNTNRPLSQNQPPEIPKLRGNRKQKPESPKQESKKDDDSYDFSAPRSTAPSQQSLSSDMQLLNRSQEKAAASNCPMPPSQTNISRQFMSPTEKEGDLRLAAVEKRSEDCSPSSRRHPYDEIPSMMRSSSPVGMNDTSHEFLPPNLIEHDDGVLSVFSGLTPALVDPTDDETINTYGFSTTSPPPTPQRRGGDDDTLGFSSLPSPILRDDEDQNYVWRDQKREAQTADDEYRTFQQRLLGQDINEVLDESYKQTMDSLSVCRRATEQKSSFDENTVGPGSLLLTESELQKHLQSVQHVEPLPASTIQGYDSWKQEKENRERYFSKLQANATRRKKQRESKIDRRQPIQSQRENPSVDRRQLLDYRNQSRTPKFDDTPNTCIDSTRSAMDACVDSTIPTNDDGTVKPRDKQKASRRRRGWGWFQFSKQKKNGAKNSEKGKRSSSSDKKSKKVKVDLKKKKHQQAPEAIPLETFMRISADEPLDVAEFSLAPLNRDETMTLATTTTPEGADPLAVTHSHSLDNIAVGPRKKAFLLLEEERQKQRQAEIDRMKEEEVERVRIKKRRQEAIDKQRCMNLQHIPRPPRQRKNRATDGSIGGSRLSNYLTAYGTQGTRVKGSDNSTGYPGDDSVLDKNISVSSKQSVDSSIKSGSGIVLSPCVICNAAERTHISMPCMHFHFCGTCVEEMYQSDCPMCPICSTGDVAFSRVYTG